MSDLAAIRRKIIRFFGKTEGTKKYTEALQIRAREGISLEDAAVKVGEGKLKREKQITKKIKTKKKNRSKDPEHPSRFVDGVRIEQGGSPGSGKRR